MKVSLHIHEKYPEPEVIVCGPENNGKLKELFALVSDAVNEKITLYEENDAVRVPCAAILRFYGEKQRVYAQTQDKVYVSRYRLYELEELMKAHQFVRISNSEIVNLLKVRRLDTSMAGTIRVILYGGIETYVSRRYMSRIRQVLVGGKETGR